MVDIDNSIRQLEDEFFEKHNLFSKQKADKVLSMIQKLRHNRINREPQMKAQIEEQVKEIEKELATVQVVSPPVTVIESTFLKNVKLDKEEPVQKLNTLAPDVNTVAFKYQQERMREAEHTQNLKSIGEMAQNVVPVVPLSGPAVSSAAREDTIKRRRMYFNAKNERRLINQLLKSKHIKALMERATALKDYYENDKDLMHYYLLYSDYMGIYNNIKNLASHYDKMLMYIRFTYLNKSTVDLYSLSLDAVLNGKANIGTDDIGVDVDEESETYSPGADAGVLQKFDDISEYFEEESMTVDSEISFRSNIKTNIMDLMKQFLNRALDMLPKKWLERFNGKVNRINKIDVKSLPQSDLHYWKNNIENMLKKDIQINPNEVKTFISKINSGALTEVQNGIKIVENKFKEIQNQMMTQRKISQKLSEANKFIENIDDQKYGIIFQIEEWHTKYKNDILAPFANTLKNLRTGAAKDVEKALLDKVDKSNNNLKNRINQRNGSIQSLIDTVKNVLENLKGSVDVMRQHDLSKAAEEKISDIISDNKNSDWFKSRLAEAKSYYEYSKKEYDEFQTELTNVNMMARIEENINNEKIKIDNLISYINNIFNTGFENNEIENNRTNIEKKIKDVLDLKSKHTKSIPLYKNLISNASDMQKRLDMYDSLMQLGSQYKSEFGNEYKNYKLLDSSFKAKCESLILKADDLTEFEGEAKRMEDLLVKSKQLNNNIDSTYKSLLNGAPNISDLLGLFDSDIKTIESNNIEYDTWLTALSLTPNEEKFLKEILGLGGNPVDVEKYLTNNYGYDSSDIKDYDDNKLDFINTNNKIINSDTTIKKYFERIKYLIEKYKKEIDDYKNVCKTFYDDYSIRTHPPALNSNDRKTYDKLDSIGQSIKIFINNKSTLFTDWATHANNIVLLQEIENWKKNTVETHINESNNLLSSADLINMKNLNFQDLYDKTYNNNDYKELYDDLSGYEKKYEKSGVANVFDQLVTNIKNLDKSIDAYINYANDLLLKKIPDRTEFTKASNDEKNKYEELVTDNASVYSYEYWLNKGNELKQFLEYLEKRITQLKNYATNAADDAKDKLNEFKKELNDEAKKGGESLDTNYKDIFDFFDDVKAQNDEFHNVIDYTLFQQNISLYNNIRKIQTFYDSIDQAISEIDKIKAKKNITDFLDQKEIIYKQCLGILQNLNLPNKSKTSNLQIFNENFRYLESIYKQRDKSRTIEDLKKIYELPLPSKTLPLSSKVIVAFFLKRPVSQINFNDIATKSEVEEILKKSLCAYAANQGYSKECFPSDYQDQNFEISDVAVQLLTQQKIAVEFKEFSDSFNLVNKHKYAVINQFMKNNDMIEHFKPEDITSTEGYQYMMNFYDYNEPNAKDFYDAYQSIIDKYQEFKNDFDTLQNVNNSVSNTNSLPNQYIDDVKKLIRRLMENKSDLRDLKKDIEDYQTTNMANVVPLLDPKGSSTKIGGFFLKRANIFKNIFRDQLPQDYTKFSDIDEKALCESNLLSYNDAFSFIILTKVLFIQSNQTTQFDLNDASDETKDIINFFTSLFDVKKLTDSGIKIDDHNQFMYDLYLALIKVYHLVQIGARQDSVDVDSLIKPIKDTVLKYYNNLALIGDSYYVNIYFQHLIYNLDITFCNCCLNKKIDEFPLGDKTLIIDNSHIKEQFNIWDKSKITKADLKDWAHAYKFLRIIGNVDFLDKNPNDVNKIFYQNFVTSIMSNYWQSSFISKHKKLFDLLANQPNDPMIRQISETFNANFLQWKNLQPIFIFISKVKILDIPDEVNQQSLIQNQLVFLFILIHSYKLYNDDNSYTSFKQTFKHIISNPSGSTTFGDNNLVSLADTVAPVFAGNVIGFNDDSKIYYNMFDTMLEPDQFFDTLRSEIKKEVLPKQPSNAAPAPVSGGGYRSFFTPILLCLLIISVLIILFFIITCDQSQPTQELITIM